MDSAEEALIIVAPEGKVVGDAVYDEMRMPYRTLWNGT
jgi:hypothetical protein